MMKRGIAILSITALLLPQIVCGGSVAAAADNSVIRALKSVVIPNFIIHDNLQTFDEVMEDFCEQVNENRKVTDRSINFVILSKKYGSKTKTPKLKAFAAENRSAYEILMELAKRKNLLFRVKGNIVYIVSPGVKMQLSFDRVCGDCRFTQRKLDEIIFPEIILDEVDFESVIDILNSGNYVAPDGEGVKVEWEADRKQRNKELYVTLTLRAVTLRELLDSICFVTGCSYDIRPDKVVFFSGKRKN